MLCTLQRFGLNGSVWGEALFPTSLGLPCLVYGYVCGNKLGRSWICVWEQALFPCSFIDLFVSLFPWSFMGLCVGVHGGSIIGLCLGWR